MFRSSACLHWVMAAAGAALIQVAWFGFGPVAVSFQSFNGNIRHQGNQSWRRYRGFAFKRDEVRIARTSGPGGCKVASDLGKLHMPVRDGHLHACKHQPLSRGRRRKMVPGSHIRDVHRSSLGIQGRPRLTEVLNGLGVYFCQRRVGRLMRQNALTSFEPASSRLRRIRK